MIVPAGVVLLCVVILSFLLPVSWRIGVPVLAVVLFGLNLAGLIG